MLTWRGLAIESCLYIHKPRRIRRIAIIPSFAGMVTRRRSPIEASAQLTREPSVLLLEDVKTLGESSGTVEATGRGEPIFKECQCFVVMFTSRAISPRQGRPSLPTDDTYLIYAGSLCHSPNRSYVPDENKPELSHFSVFLLQRRLAEHRKELTELGLEATRGLSIFFSEHLWQPCKVSYA